MVVVFASTELEELLELGDVIITMHDGRIVNRYDDEVDGARADAGHDPAEEGAAMTADRRRRSPPVSAGAPPVAGPAHGRARCASWLR